MPPGLSVSSESIIEHNRFTCVCEILLKMPSKRSGKLAEIESGTLNHCLTKICVVKESSLHIMKGIVDL